MAINVDTVHVHFADISTPDHCEFDIPDDCDIVRSYAEVRFEENWFVRMGKKLNLLNYCVSVTFKGMNPEERSKPRPIPAMPPDCEPKRDYGFP